MLPQPLSDRPSDSARDSIVKMLEEADLTEFHAWNELDALSSHTQLDGIEVDPAGILLDDDRFRGIMSVYVTLSYGGDGEDGFDDTDAFSGEFDGHFDRDRRPVIDRLTIDTSPFYGTLPEPDVR